MNSAKTIQGQVRNQKFVGCAVGVDEKRVEYVADIAAQVVGQQKPNLPVTKDQIRAFNVVSLKAALIKAIDEDAKLDARIRIPCYFDSMICGLRTEMGRSVVNPTLSSTKIVVPDDYQDVVTALTIAGVKLVKPHGPVAGKSPTLALFIETVDDVEVITGNLTDVALEDMIRRSLLRVRKEDEAVLRGIVGELRLQYGELDDLILNYYSAEVGTAV